MPAPSDRPLRKITMNLFESDCEWLERWYGRGWTEIIRNLASNHVKAKHLLNQTKDILNERD